MAVYTPVTFDEAAAHLQAHYSIGELQEIQPIAEGIENSNFLLVTTQGKFILTLFEKRVKAEDMPAILAFMNQCGEYGVPSPLSVPSRQGDALRALNGKPAVIVTFLSGRPASRVTPRHIELLGETVARMHEAGRLASAQLPANPLSVAGWRRLEARIGEGLDSIVPNLQAGMREELDYLETHWPQALPKGAIHADLFPDNVFYDETHLKPHLSGIIDFYFACTDFFAYDLAIILNAWCFDEKQLMRKDCAQALIQGYQANRVMQREEKEALPILARGAALRFLLTRAYDWLNRVEGALVTPKDPMEYVRKLHFHQQKAYNFLTSSF